MGSVLTCCDDNATERPKTLQTAKREVNWYDGKTVLTNSPTPDADVKTQEAKYPVEMVNIKAYEQIMTKCQEEGKVTAEKMSLEIESDPTLGNSTINWTAWNHFIHQAIFCPETDVFHYEKLMLVGLLLCKGTDAEKAKVLWNLVQNRKDLDFVKMKSAFEGIVDIGVNHLAEQKQNLEMEKIEAMYNEFIQEVFGDSAATEEVFIEKV